MSQHEKTVEQTYQILDEIEHVRKRSGIYMGSTSRDSQESYVISDGQVIRKKVNIIPAFLKIFDEILTNACDESRRAPETLDTINVSIEPLTGEISVSDNGRGIPVKIHAETGQYVPEMVFTNLRAGSNFNDDEDQSMGGTNGVGATLCVIMSENFIVETADGTHGFRQEYSKGLREKSEARVFSSTQHYTRVTYTPDYEFFKMDSLDDDHISVITKRVYDAAATRPSVTFYLNGTRVDISGFADYVKMYTPDHIYEESDKWRIAVANAENGFEQVSFVNGVSTYNGGTHVSYITNQLVTKIREFILKKHKVDVKPAYIKNHLRVFVSCDLNRPKFTSQSKETLASTSSEWKSSHEVSAGFIKKVIASDIINSILDWAMAAQNAAELADERKLNRSNDRLTIKKIAKFHDATTTIRKNAVLALCEGDSALKPLLGCRDPSTLALFPLKGRPINVSATNLATIKKNVEFESIRSIIGLKYGVKADVSSLNFGKILICVDSDEFGKTIAGLIINMFYRLWPEIVESGMIYRLVTPAVIVNGPRGFEKEFFSLAEFEAWSAANTDRKFSYRFLKGLGSNNSKQFKKYLDNPDKYMFQFTMEENDKQMLDLCFLKEKGFTDQRKVWLALED